MAMKALAKDQKDRYPHVKALRRDIERFQEGRSVSAKEDTRGELLIKLVKRNKGVSAATAAALVLLTLVVVWSSVVNYKARRDAEAAYADYRNEQRDKEERTRNAVPALVKAAPLAVDKRQYDNALTQVKLALDYDADHDEARLLKGQLLIVPRTSPPRGRNWSATSKRKPADGEAHKLKDLCGRSRRKTWAICY